MIDYPWIICKYPGMYTQNRAGNMSLASILVKLCQLLGCVLCYCILITCWPSMQENSLHYGLNIRQYCIDPPKTTKNCVLLLQNRCATKNWVSHNMTYSIFSCIIIIMVNKCWVKGWTFYWSWACITHEGDVLQWLDLSGPSK